MPQLSLVLTITKYTTTPAIPVFLISLSLSLYPFVSLGFAAISEGFAFFYIALSSHSGSNVRASCVASKEKILSIVVGKHQKQQYNNGLHLIISYYNV